MSARFDVMVETAARHKARTYESAPSTYAHNLQMARDEARAELVAAGVPALIEELDAAHAQAIEHFQSAVEMTRKRDELRVEKERLETALREARLYIDNAHSCKACDREAMSLIDRALVSVESPTPAISEHGRAAMEFVAGYEAERELESED